MIPFEEEPSLTASEEYAQQILESNWSHVVRTTPGIKKDLEEKHPQISETVSRNINKDLQKQSFTDIFRPGVPDFLAFNQKGGYKFIEIKSGKDGLRHTQLKWLRDFQGIQAEIWFTNKKQIESKLDADNISAYTFQDKKAENAKNQISEEKESKYLVELPKTLATILNLSKNDSVKWRLKNKNELILDSK